MGLISEYENVINENDKIPENKNLIDKLKRLKSETSI